jgi:hypothetical protein
LASPPERAPSPLLLEVRLNERDADVLLESGVTMIPGVTVIELHPGQGEPPNPAARCDAAVAGDADALKSGLSRDPSKCWTTSGAILIARRSIDAHLDALHYTTSCSNSRGGVHDFRASSTSGLRPHSVL